jgi:hypothetical protein
MHSQSHIRDDDDDDDATDAPRPHAELFAENDTGKRYKVVSRVRLNSASF